MGLQKLSLDFPRFFNTLTSDLPKSTHDAFKTVIRGLEKLHLETIKAVNANADVFLNTPSWIAPTLLNSWADFGSGWSTAAYVKVGNRVEIKGLIKSGTIPGTAFTLPADYRPAEHLTFVTIHNTGVGRVEIKTDGNVQIPAGSTSGWLSLDGISFYV